MTAKPTMRTEVAVSVVAETVRSIYFYATQDAVTEFTEFGEIEKAGSANYYRLEVDARFDFQEVVSFIRGYGSQG